MNALGILGNPGPSVQYWRIWHALSLRVSELHGVGTRFPPQLPHWLSYALMLSSNTSDVVFSLPTKSVCPATRTSFAGTPISAKRLTVGCSDRRWWVPKHKYLGEDGREASLHQPPSSHCLLNMVKFTSILVVLASLGGALSAVVTVATVPPAESNCLADVSTKVRDLEDKVKAFEGTREQAIVGFSVEKIVFHEFTSPSGSP